MAQRKQLILLLLALLVTALAACAGNVDQTITFLADEQWESEVTLAYPAEMAPVLGGQIDNELNSLQQQIESQGGQMTWERSEEDGALSYTIDASGRGYDILRDVAIGDMTITATETDGERELTFTAAPLLDAQSQTLTVIGGEILNANGSIDGDSVTWVNSPVVMQAVLTERGGVAALPWLPILGGLALILAGGGLLAWLLMRQRRRPAAAWSAGSASPPSPYPGPAAPPAYPAAPPPPSAAGKAAIAPGAAPASRFCVNCGTTLRPNAKFCAACGHPQPD